MSVTSFHVLGPLTAWRDGGSLALGGPRPRALVIRLLIARNRTVPVDTLLDDLWGDDQPRSARNTLQSYVSVLRRALGDDAPIVHEGMGYRIDVDGDAVDAVRAERWLAEATELLEQDPHRALTRADEVAALWRGPALADVRDEGWAHAEAARLDELRVTADELRASALLALGRHDEAVRELDRVCAAHPYRERPVALLATALYRAGRQVEALRCIDRLADQLREDLGLSMGPELAALQKAVLDHDPALSSPAPAVRAPVAAAAPPVAGQPFPILLPPHLARRRDRVPFVGRHTECEGLRDAWQRSTEGERLVVLVDGEAGTGKTRLVSEVVRELHRSGADVLWGRARADTQGAYDTITDVVANVMHQLDGPVRDDLLGTQPMIARLVPELLPVGSEPATLAGDAAADRRRLVDAVANLASFSGRGVVVVLDDVQWIDPSSLALVELLLRSPRAGHLLVVMTRRTRPETPNAELDRFLLDLDRAGSLARLVVRAFTHDEIGDFATAALGAPLGDEALDHVLAATGGNAFFLEEVLRSSGPDLSRVALPQSVQDVIDHRLAQLDATARSLVELAAVGGIDVRVDELARWAQRAPIELVEPLDSAIRVGLLRDGASGHVGFAHSLARSAVLASITSLRRAVLHLQVAEALEAARTSERVHHLEQAGSLAPAERMAAAYLDRGCAALDRGAYRAALADADRVVGRDDLGASQLLADALDLQGEARWGLGQAREARESFRRLRDLGDRLGDANLLMRAVAGMVNGNGGLGFTFNRLDTEVAELLDRLLAIPDLPDEVLVNCLAGSVATRAMVDPPGSLVPLARRALELAERLDDDACGVGLVALRIALWDPGHLADRLEVSERATRLGPAVRPALRLATLVGAVADRLEHGIVDLSLLDAMDAELVRAPIPAYVAYRYFLTGSIELLRGEYDAALRHADEAYDAAHQSFGGGAAIARDALHLIAARDRGTLPAYVPAEPRYEGGVVLPIQEMFSALAMLEFGDRGPAASTLHDLVPEDGPPRLRFDAFWLASCMILVECAAALGDARRAEVLADTLRPYRYRIAVIGASGGTGGPVGRGLAIAEAVAGRWDVAAEVFDETLAQCRAIGARPFEARILADRAVVAAALGDEAAAAEMRDAAERLREELGAPGLRGALRPDVVPVAG